MSFKDCINLQTHLTDKDSKFIEALNVNAVLIIFRYLVDGNQTPLEVLSMILFLMLVLLFKYF
jgi:hypothetical protein